MARDFDTQDFIRHAQLAFGNKYDYGATQYRGMGGSIIVLCRRHGGFETTPERHLDGEGCPQCAAPSLAANEH